MIYSSAFSYLNRILALYIWFLVPCFGQQAPSDPTAMSSREFEVWIVSQIQLSQQRTSLRPDFCHFVIDRLKAERYTTPKSILSCVEAWISHESISAKTDSASKRFEDSFKFLNSVKGTLPDQIYLTAKLERRRANLFEMNGDLENAVRSYKTGLLFFEPFRLEVDQERLRFLLKLGDDLISVKQHKQAEDAYLQVLSYPWYTVSSYPNEMQALRDLYVRAGYGLIGARRGNLAALKQIVFVPATLKELGPVLEQAIREAER